MGLEMTAPQHLIVNVIERFDSAGKPFIHVDVDEMPIGADLKTPARKNRESGLGDACAFNDINHGGADDVVNRG